MFSPSRKPRIFALPPGVDFLQGLIEGLNNRLAGAPPEAIARVEIFVNTRRTARRLADLFANGPGGLTPRIRLITDLAGDVLVSKDTPPATSPLRRRLELSQAVAALLDQEPDFAPRSAIYDLADSLANLMDEMSGEGVTPGDLRSIDVKEHSAHWERTLKFLNILTAHFTDKNQFAPDIEARQRMVVEHLVSRWKENPPTNPVIVAGSTGSRGATALFMKAVASLPQGALVLPGFDFDLPAGVWEALKDVLNNSDHPQARFANLFGHIGFAPEDVKPWADVNPASAARNKVISLAMRPAPITDQWLTEGPLLADISGATDDVGLIEAPSQRLEALAIALRLRAAANDGIKATLISPDRVLTRQVTAALERWNILPDDSAGEPLPQSPPGTFLRLIANLMGQRLTSEALLILLKHPLTHSGGEGRNTHLLLTRELEIQVLRRGLPFPDFDLLRQWARERKDGAEAVVWISWLRGIFERLEHSSPSHLSSHLAMHRDIAERLANGPAGKSDLSALWQKSAGTEAAKVFSELEAAADAGGVLAPTEYAALFRSVLNTGVVRDAVTPHPDITIWGTIEARVQGADLVILGGLNDGSWPKTPTPDPWLNRAMRMQAGLLLPERQIGLAAHDFQQAIAVKKVLLTRSVRDADAPTVASRWLIRLTNLLGGLDETGKPALSDMRMRGQRWLDMAVEMEKPGFSLPPAPRPSPRPPVAARPGKLSVTRIKTLIRDPYSIYAQYILRLRKLDPLLQEPDAPKRGQVLHTVLEEFITQTLDGLPDDAAASLLSVAEKVFDSEAPWPAARRIWLARLQRIAAWFIAEEEGRRAKGHPVALERKGSVQMVEPEFTLTAEADRIDLNSAGQLTVFDYKTGAVPSAKQVQMFDKQLPLEGLIAERGGFGDLGAASVVGLEYIGLGGAGKSQPINISDDLINETWESLRRLVRAYQSPETGYTARARMEKRTDVSDTDHLSRRGEWDDSDAPVGEEMS